MQSERRRISRELHDTIGHTLSVISLHAGVGEEALGHDDAAVTAALGRIREQSTASLQDLRGMVRLLREDEDSGELRHVRSLADLDGIVAEAASAGVEVDTEVSVGDLPATVEGAAYRVVQESITNIIRHARARTAQVRIVVADDELRITVHDDGRGASPEDNDGYGIAGMRERVRLLGGVLTTTSTPGEGFNVTARIPIGSAR